jgi:hypothetical protein
MNAVMQHKVGLGRPSHFAMLRGWIQLWATHLQVQGMLRHSHDRVVANGYLVESRLCTMSKSSVMEGLRKNR